MQSIKVENFKLKINSGVVALPVVLLIGGIITEIGIAGAFLAYFLLQSGYGIKLSAEALGASQAGLQDAFIRIVRDKTFSSSGYDIAVGSRSAHVTVCRDLKTVNSLCDTSNVGKDEITSLGVASTKERELRALVNVNGTTGEVKTESISEVSL